MRTNLRIRREIQLLRSLSTMEGPGSQAIDWFRSPSIGREREEGGQWYSAFHWPHNLPVKHYGGTCVQLMRDGRTWPIAGWSGRIWRSTVMSTPALLLLWQFGATRSSIQELLVCLILTGNWSKPQSPECSDLMSKKMGGPTRTRKVAQIMKQTRMPRTKGLPLLRCTKN